MHTNNYIDFSNTTIRQKSNLRAANISKTSSMTGMTGTNDPSDLGLYVIK
jgi:hypothetical protein